MIASVVSQKTKKNKPTPVWLDDQQVQWLKSQPNGISGTVRNLVFEAMNLDNLARSVTKKRRKAGKR